MQEHGLPGLDGSGQLPPLEDESQKALKAQRQKLVLAQVAKELEAERNSGKYVAKFCAPTPADALAEAAKLPPDPNAAGFPARALERRDEQTEKVTSLLLTGLPAKEIMELMDVGVYKFGDTLRPVEVPDLRTAELLEAKSLLESLNQSVGESHHRLSRYDKGHGSASTRKHSPGKRAPGSEGFIREGLGVRMNGVLYASWPPPSEAMLPTAPDPKNGHRPGRAWL